ncbi:hypothetical protein [aff. Roholtiella sp. LEGE 12411]|uniref:hypothetical protein n=1 Tax=aff. Roholtiella sp. LEGE 12411 TaxID=1828822 RepID=UPI001882D9A6|nr:hypothetical protein [aff. Roholtiella sp. LEGE 12411]MBE9033908.1 hypothetical protein [aff. Roholtiella sp. LEGE 12411]
MKGFPKRQFFIASGLKNTKRHREIVRSRRDAIATDIALQRFDSSLDSYQFRASAQVACGAIASRAASCQYDLGQLWKHYTEFQSHQLEKTTI